MADAQRKLGDLICEVLTFCYSQKHKKALSKDAKEMGATYEQFVAASLATRIGEKFEIRERILKLPFTN